MIYHVRSVADDYNSFNDLAETVKATVRNLAAHRDDFTGIIVTGTSGMAVGFPVALALDVPIAVLRKDDEASHGSRGEIIGFRDIGNRVLFLDDFVSLGVTRARVVRAVEQRVCYSPDYRKKSVAPTGKRVVAMYVYREGEYTRNGTD